MGGFFMSIWTKNFILLCLANLAVFFSVHILTPTVPVYLLDIGGVQRDVGYVMAAYTIGALLVRPVGGYLVDRFSRKKILLFGMIMMLIITIFYQMAKNISLMMAIRCLHGVTFGLISTALGTMVADTLPPAHLGEGMGYFGLANSLSMSLAPMFGFWIVGQSSYPMLFLTVSFLAALAFFCGLIVKSTDASDCVQPDKPTRIRDRIFEKTALAPSVLVFFLCVVHGSIMSFIALYAAEQGISNIGFFFTSMASSMLISRPIAGRWMDKGGINMVMLISHLALIIGMIAIALSHTITNFVLAGVFAGIGFGFCFPTLQALAVYYTPVRRRGAATATFFIFVDLGIAVGTIIWGYLAEAVGYQTMYFTTLIPIAIAGGIYFWVRNSRQTFFPETKVPLDKASL
jgi:MFS family permease